MSASINSREGKKISKMDKINELQAVNKGLKEENRSLRRKLYLAKSGYSTGAQAEEESINSANEEKLMEAMMALRSVTVKQEMNLSALRSKSRQRRKEVVERDRTISKLLQEIDELRLAHSARREVQNGDNGSLRSKLEDLEIRCAEHESRNSILLLQAEESEDKISNLEKELEKVRDFVDCQQCANNSKSSEESCISEYDVKKIRNELASKIEQIVLLEFDLEMCKEELNELKQKERNLDQDKNSQEELNEEDFFSEGDDGELS